MGRRVILRRDGQECEARLGAKDLTRSGCGDNARPRRCALHAQFLLHRLATDGERHEVVAWAHERWAAASETTTTAEASDLYAESRHEVLPAEAAATSRWLARQVEELRHLLQRLEIGLTARALATFHAEGAHERA